MGMIPILLALSGFILLWAILNYNNLLSRQSLIQELIHRNDVFYNQRKEIILDINNLFTRHKVNGEAFLAQLEYLPQNRSITNESTVQTQGQIHLSALQQHPDFISLLASLGNTDREIAITQNKLRQLTSAYNSQVSKMPSRLVATLFGFKPMNLSGM